MNELDSMNTKETTNSSFILPEYNAISLQHVTKIDILGSVSQYFKISIYTL